MKTIVNIITNKEMIVSTDIASIVKLCSQIERCAQCKWSIEHGECGVRIIDHLPFEYYVKEK